jgi:hypothetical protein
VPATSVPDGPLEIEEHRCFPNPVVGAGLGAARVAVKLKGSAEKLTLKVYSRAMTCLGTYESGPLGPGWQRMPLPQAFIDQAGNGTYFYVVCGERKGSKTEDAIGRVTVLR